MKITQKAHKILVAAVSIIIAICMWLYVAPDGETVYRNLSVAFVNEASLQDYSLMLDMDTTPTVSVSISGKRSELINLDRDNITVTVDLAKIQSPGTYELSYTVELPTSRTSSMEVSNYITSSVTVTVVQQVSKTIDVKAVWTGELAEGDYLAEQIVVEPAQITIYGPEEVVEPVNYAQVVLDRTNLDKTVTESLSYTLVDDNGEPVYSDKISCDVDLIETTQPIVMTKELTLGVSLVDGAGATEDYAVVEIEPKTITISGEQATLDGINSITLGTIDLGDIIGSEEYTFQVLIPNDTKNLSEVNEATVTVTIKGLESEQFRVSKDRFEMINGSEEFDYTFLSQYLQVTVRAPSSTISAIQSNNIRVVADLSSVTGIGLQEVPVTVYVDGYSDAGVLGSYTVYVTVTIPSYETEEATQAAEEETPAAELSESTQTTEDEEPEADSQ